MLKINIAGQNVDLPDNINIPLKLKNPMFHDVGSFSLNFNIPLTDRNKKTFNFLNRISNNLNGSIEEDCDISFNIPLFKGYIKCNKSSKAGFKSSFYSDLGAFFSGAQKKNLPDLELGGDVIFADTPTKYAHYKATTNGEYPDYNMVMFPVRNDGFTGDAPVTAEMWQNRWFWEKQGGVDTSYFAKGNYSITPFPYFAFVIKQAFLENGYSILKNIFASDPDLVKLVVFNVNDTDWYERPSHSYNLSKHVPDISIASMIQNIKKRFNIGCFINSNSREVVILKHEDIINDSDYIDITNKASSEFETETFDNNGFILKFNQGDDEFWDENVKDILHSDRVQDPVATIGDLAGLSPDVGDIVLVEDEDNYYNYSPSGWILSSKGVQNNYIEGNEELTIESDLGYLANNLEEGDAGTSSGLTYTDFPTVTYYDWLIPYTSQLGNSWYPRFEAIEYPLRLLFYRGLVDSENPSYDYPLGSHDVYDYNGNKISDANLALRWDGQYGIYENFWKNYLYWYLNIRKEIKLRINWAISDLANIKFYKKYRINRTDYLIKDIDINLTKTKINIGTTTLIKV